MHREGSERQTATFRRSIIATLLTGSMWAATTTPLLAQEGSKTLQQSAPAVSTSLLNYIQSGRLEEAMQLGRQAVERWPDDAEIHHLLGVAYFKSRQHSLAITELEKAETLDQANPDIHFDLALVYIDQTEYQPAAKELEKSVKLDPKNAVAHVLLGRAYQNTNRTLEAIDQFKEALIVDPNVRLGHYDLGFAYASLGREQEALAEYEKEKARSPDNADVLYQLGHLLLQTGDVSSAVKYLKRATEAEIDPQNAEAFYDLGKSLALAGDSGSAISALERSAALRPTDPSPHYQLARVYERLGKRDDAQREWQTFAALKKAQPQTGGMASGQPQ